MEFVNNTRRKEEAKKHSSKIDNVIDILEEKQIISKKEISDIKQGKKRA